MMSDPQMSGLHRESTREKLYVNLKHHFRLTVTTIEYARSGMGQLYALRQYESIMNSMKETLISTQEQHFRVFVFMVEKLDQTHCFNIGYIIAQL